MAIYGFAGYGMANDVKIDPAELGSKRERVARNLSDRIVAVDVP